MATDTQFVDRFHHEAKVGHSNRSNIAAVYDMGDVDHTLYMAIEYIPGVDLSRVENAAAARPQMPVPIAVMIGQQMCEASATPTAARRRRARWASFTATSARRT